MSVYLSCIRPAYLGCPGKETFEQELFASVDIDECAEGLRTCDQQSFCRNTEGSSACIGDCITLYNQYCVYCVIENEFPLLFWQSLGDTMGMWHVKACFSNIQRYCFGWSGPPPSSPILWKEGLKENQTLSLDIFWILESFWIPFYYFRPWNWTLLLKSYAEALCCLGNLLTFSWVSRMLSNEVLRMKYLIKHFGDVNCLKLNRHIWRIMLKKISCDQQLFQIVVVFYFAVGLFFCLFGFSKCLFHFYSNILFWGPSLNVGKFRRQGSLNEHLVVVLTNTHTRLTALFPGPLK